MRIMTSDFFLYCSINEKCVIDTFPGWYTVVNDIWNLLNMMYCSTAPKWSVTVKKKKTKFSKPCSPVSFHFNYFYLILVLLFCVCTVFFRNRQGMTGAWNAPWLFRNLKRYFLGGEKLYKNIQKIMGNKQVKKGKENTKIKNVKIKCNL